LNVRLPGVTLSDGLAEPPVTANVTAIFSGELEAPEAVTVTVPLYVPLASPVGLTPMLRLPGVPPLAGETVSHAADAAAV
jgi:hypothetical protein